MCVCVCVCVAVLDGKQALCCGLPVGAAAGNGRLSSVERYDPVTNAWEAVAPMATARIHLAAAALNGKLYAVGGYSVRQTVSQ